MPPQHRSSGRLTCTTRFPGHFMGRGPALGSGQEVFKTHGSSRDGSGGARNFTGRAGRVGSEFFQYHGSGRDTLARPARSDLTPEKPWRFRAKQPKKGYPIDFFGKNKEKNKPAVQVERSGEHSPHAQDNDTCEKGPIMLARSRPLIFPVQLGTYITLLLLQRASHFNSNKF